MALKKLIVATVLLIVCFQGFSEEGDRYQLPIFDDVTITSDVQFGESVDENGTTINLLMDIYEGAGDSAINRPVVIMCHGGTFIGGTKNDGDMEFLCDELAKMGYVCASINYRITSTWNIIYSDTMVKTVMRAVQDAKAAVRYFRKDAATTDEYKINPDAIFMGGSSAGGVLALHLAYMDRESELTVEWQQFAGSLGGIEGNSGNPGYPSDVAGVISYAGALADTNWLEVGDVPFFTMHSENDLTVQYGYGPPVQSGNLPSLYGSAPLKVRADNIGVDNEFHSYAGGNHPPYNGASKILDTTATLTANFVFKHLPKNVAAPTLALEYDHVVIFPNPTSGKFTLELNNQDLKSHTITIHNSIGLQVFKQENITDQKADFDLVNVSTGLYFLSISDESNQNTIVRKLLIQK